MEDCGLLPDFLGRVFFLGGGGGRDGGGVESVMDGCFVGVNWLLWDFVGFFGVMVCLS